MSFSNLLRAAAVAWLLSASSALAFPQSIPPHLSHSAPFVGHTLTLEIEGAVPLSPIELYFSPEDGSFATSYGILELRRDSLELLASGTTTASGTWSFALTVPLDPALAEAGAHFQALVDDPAAPAGRIFSDAVHARFLGPRVYDGHGGSMCIVSAITDTVVARVDFGATDGSAAIGADPEPVFDAAFSRGAVMVSGRELQFFDPFYGALQSRITFASICSGTLLTDADHQTIYLLESAGGPSPARIHAIDLATGTETAYLDLPNPVEGKWCVGRSSLEAFVAEHDSAGRTAIRHVGLQPLVDRGSTPVGGTNSTSFGALVYARSQLIVSTTGFQAFPPSAEGYLTRCQVASTGIVGRAVGLGPISLYHLAAVPAADRVLGGQMHMTMGPAGMCQMPLSRVERPSGLPGPWPNGLAFVQDIEADDKVAWIVGESEWQHSDQLFRLDLETMIWTVTPFSWFTGRNDAEVLRDVSTYEVWVSNEGQYGAQRPGIQIVDELNGTARHLDFDHYPGKLHGVPLP